MITYAIQPCIYFSPRIRIFNSTWSLTSFVKWKVPSESELQSIVPHALFLSSPGAYNGTRNTSRAPPKFDRNKMQAKIKSWYVCLCIADALHEALDLSQGVPTFGKFAESWRFHQSPWGITLREHSAKTAEVNVRTLWKTTGCFVSRGVTWMHY